MGFRKICEVVKMTAFETKIKNYKQYVIETEEGIERGIFFRKPIQRIDFMDYYDTPFMSASEYLTKLKNPVRRIYERMIGNGNLVKNLAEWMESCDFAGCAGNILCSPIYFKRDYRKLKAYSQDCNTNIQELCSYGYESEFNLCGGACDREITHIKLRSGKKIKIKGKDKYNYTYSFMIEELIDKENVNV